MILLLAAVVVLMFLMARNAEGALNDHEEHQELEVRLGEPQLLYPQGRNTSGGTPSLRAGEPGR